MSSVNPSNSAWLRCALPLVLSLASPAVRAASVTITSSADTTLSENYPSNNLGGVTFANSGTTQNLTRNRALFKFDVAAAVPAGALIRNASLVLEVIHQPSDGYAFADFGLYRLLHPWGEGSKTSPTNGLNPGSGSLASTNEATWLFRFAFTTNTWTSPGAASTNDYISTPSAAQTIYGLGDSPYTFGPTPALAADLQFWLDHPQANFGWILVCHDETTPFTARRFASHENTNAPPSLGIDYLVPPRIESAQRVGAQFNLVFTALPGQSYLVQFCDSVPATTWQSLASLPPQPQPTRVLVADPATAPLRFYRIQTF